MNHALESGFFKNDEQISAFPCQSLSCASVHIVIINTATPRSCASWGVLFSESFAFESQTIS